MLLELTSSISLMYFSMTLRSDETEILLVVTTILLLLEYMKSTEVSNLIFLSH